MATEPEDLSEIQHPGLSKTECVERRCTRADCEGWAGTVTYRQVGESPGEWTFHVIEECVAIEALLASDGADVQGCPAADSGRYTQVES